jgi:hypothetical protein
MKERSTAAIASSEPAPRDAPPSTFNGHVLDRKREDVYVLMHQIGLIR